MIDDSHFDELASRGTRGQPLGLRQGSNSMASFPSCETVGVNYDSLKSVMALLDSYRGA
jgi:hypothetical protein